MKTIIYFIFIFFNLSLFNHLVFANNPLVESFSIQLSKQLEQSIRKSCNIFTTKLAKEEMQDSLGPINPVRFKKVYNNNYPMCMVETISRVKKYFSTINVKPK